MATVTGLTAERMLEIEAASVVDGEVDGSGDLILTTHGGTPINAGRVKGDDGEPGEPGEDGAPGPLLVGAIYPWASSVIPDWGLELNGQTIVGGVTSHSALAAIYPGWVVGDDLVLPDWSGGTLYGHGAAPFDGLGNKIGDLEHTHGLSDEGYAKLASTSNALYANFLTKTSWNTATAHTASRSSAPSNAVQAIGLGGETDGASSLPPGTVVKWVVCAVSSVGDFDPIVQQALVSRVSPTMLFRERVIFTSSGTFDKNDYPWLRAIRVRAVGGGGAGTASTNNNRGYEGGGAGATAESFITDIAGLPSSVAVTVGAGGVGSGSHGTAGGASSFGAIAVAGGGQVTGSGSGITGGPGGTATAGDLLIAGGDGGPGGTSSTSGGVGGASSLGGGGRGGYSSTSANQDGSAGRAYGAGGGGGYRYNSTGAKGGDGAPGVVILELYA